MTFIIDSNLLALTAIVTVGMQLTFFAIAWTLQIDKLTDLAGSTNFLVIAWLTFFVQEHYTARNIIVLILVTVWGVRLGSFLLYRVLKRGKDDRFNEMRAHFWQFLGFWVGQMVWAWTVSLPVTFLMGAVYNERIGARDIIGWIIWLVGFLFETAADVSKQMHYNDESKRKEHLHEGVWSISRHPNYFGEIMCWLGIFLTASSVFDSNTKAAYVSVLSPIFTAVLLLFASGMPIAEESSDRKFGHKADYIAYKRDTSPLIPLPPAVYGPLPKFIKTLFLLELPLYNKLTLKVGLKHKSKEDKEKEEKEKKGKESSKSSKKDKNSDDDSSPQPANTTDNFHNTQLRSDEPHSLPSAYQASS